MFRIQASPKFWRNLCLAVAVAIFLVLVSCSNQPENQASNSPTKQAASKPAAPANKPAAAKPVSVSNKVTEPSQLVTVPKGTTITATVGQTLAVDKSHPGDSFSARLSSPITVDGKVVIPKGAQVTGRVVTVKKHELKVTLASVRLHGKSYDLATNSLRPSDKTKADSSAKDNATTQDKTNADKKDKNATLRAQTQLTFKLAKPVTVPAKS